MGGRSLSKCTLVVLAAHEAGVHVAARRSAPKGQSAPHECARAPSQVRQRRRAQLLEIKVEHFARDRVQVGAHDDLAAARARSAARAAAQGRRSTPRAALPAAYGALRSGAGASSSTSSTFTLGSGRSAGSTFTAARGRHSGSQRREPRCGWSTGSGPGSCDSQQRGACQMRNCIRRLAAEWMRCADRAAVSAQARMPGSMRRRFGSSILPRLRWFKSPLCSCDN